jgi:hypothetical protein
MLPVHFAHHRNRFGRLVSSLISRRTSFGEFGWKLDLLAAHQLCHFSIFVSPKGCPVLARKNLPAHSRFFGVGSLRIGSANSTARTSEFLARTPNPNILTIGTELLNAGAISSDETDCCRRVVSAISPASRELVCLKPFLQCPGLISL